MILGFINIIQNKIFITILLQECHATSKYILQLDLFLLKLTNTSFTFNLAPQNILNLSNHSLFAYNLTIKFTIFVEYFSNLLTISLGSNLEQKIPQ